MRSLGLLAAAALLAAAVVGNGWVALSGVRTLGQSFAAVEHSHEILQTLDAVLSAVQDAETGQRGYLLTGEEPYLDPYQAAAERVDSLVARLGVLVSDNPRQLPLVPQMQERVREKFAELDETVRLRREVGPEAALAVVRTDRGKRAMDALRAVEAEMDRVARERLAEREARARTAGRRAMASVVLGGAGLLAALALVGLLLRRNLRIRERDAAELRASHDALTAALAERQQALALTQAMQGQLVQQEKLASLGRLTAGVAHELKNPLNFVNNFAQLSQELVGELEEAVATCDLSADARGALGDLRQNTDKVLTHGRRADEIVQSMLIHARGVSGERERADLHALLDLAAEQALGPGANDEDHDGRPDVRIERDYDVALAGPVVEGVPTALTRLLLNLVENALHAVRQRAGTAEPGYVPTVRLTSRRERDRLGRDVATVVVADNGPGIPDALLPRVFEPFFTTKAPGQGTGLGLSLAYDIALGHGGTLLADRSESLDGAEITLTLPLDGMPDEGPGGADGAG